MLKKTLTFIILLSVLGTIFNLAYAQPAWTVDLLGKQKKPDKFENRKLGSEKMADKKFTPIRHLFQNTYTHYNYYYNANNKINTVIERAKIAQIDDYSKLLSFYPYSLDNTSTQAAELDSVILKATAGILLHDLRNDWIDNMYLLMGKAYFFRKEFDSAAATFQFINYNLYPRKKRNEDDDKIVGTNYEASKGTISIANKEKQNLLQKIASKPPSRNDAFIWLVRTFIEQEEYGAAAGLIKTLQNDPNLPRRLQNDLDEVYAYWFYKQNTYDSAAVYLEKGLSNADNKQDKSRSEFLLAQLYELTGEFDKASDYYAKASKHTTSPLMDIYANLNDAKMFKGNVSGKELDNSISNLLHMAKKDKFEAYKDIIYYSAAQLAMQKPDTANAITYLNKSLLYNQENIVFKNKAYLLLADIAYERKQYKLAAAAYDSLETTDTSFGERLLKILERKSGLSKIVKQINIIERQDSLQRIATLTPLERDTFLKKLSKKLRKEKGLKEEDYNGGVVIGFENNKEKAIDLFSDNSGKGEWYFYNASTKAKGFSEFKRRWGNRDNTDNWRRKAALDASMSNDIIAINPDMDIDPTGITNTTTPVVAPTEEDISYDGLLANIPLTEEKMIISHSLIDAALFDLAQLYQNDLEDYKEAINTYQESLKRYPDSLHEGKIYLGLYYCYTKLNDLSQAAFYKNLLTTKLANSISAKLLTDPASAKPELKNNPATKRYADIYNLFIEGKFAEALTEKQKADSLYGKSYWSPQLLYIEAIYHVKQKDDSVAKIVLKNIIQLYPSSPLKIKAESLLDVLSRRDEIEKYLTALEITRAKEDDIIHISDNVVKNTIPVNNNQPVIDSAQRNITVPPSLDNKTQVISQANIITSGPFSFDASLPHNVIMLLTKVDGTYINEAKNAFNRFVSEGFGDRPITLTKDALDGDNTLLIFSSFTDANKAIEYMNKLRRAAPSEVSWLDAGKYSFFISTDENLQKLKANKDLTGYKALLNKQYPGKF
ncbi:tetratricopeptide repeat protein [Ferruginibacter lapsinanis]|uniref:type IX secretion system periplasmic lipoprotein PorW/SprE n=1 Tax=Ferruginibacter lapsinanis TaxID=563172 RepID=UPI001E40B3B5|nr:tetratricopeptide repeat protein [Ferruginibacter lapsinanis]UEG49115.1 tetratricopeptide repeat protein [Ferruginibacter lapsinanis]